MTFDFSKVLKPQPVELAQDNSFAPQEVREEREIVTPVVKPLAVTPVKLAVKPLPQAVATMSYKEQLAEMPNLDDLANEFNNSEQPEDFNDAATQAVHKACLAIESAIDNADEVRTQLTFIMTELRKYPETAAKIYDSDIATMVKALRHNYNVVAFAKAANKKAKAEKVSKVNDLLAEADASGLFDGLDL